MGNGIVIGVASETAPGERRVAITPETCRKLIAAGAQVRLQRGLGDGAYFTDAAYTDAGAQLVDDVDAALSEADLVLCVQAPAADVIARLKTGAALVGILQPQADAVRAQALQSRGVLAFPLERLPRTTRAQAMDVLSSQAGMAGYKAVLIAAQLAPRFFPMLTTAA
ncbi:MAG: transhydrogenase subunit alpha, partial [Xanthomonadaceae bacterium]|nr:transhydrogenase subunit alpha [Xanthomonadaceae bacterium]